MSDTMDSENEDVGPIVSVQEAPRTGIAPDVDEKTKTRRQPPYHVILLNDEEHTFDYVIELLMKVFGHPKPTAEELTLQVHLRGRAIVLTTHRELAELKREQVLAYGPDFRMDTSTGPIGCVIEASA